MGPVDPADPKADVPMEHAAAVLALGEMGRDVAARLGISVADLYARIARTENGGRRVPGDGARFLLDGLGVETIAEARQLIAEARAYRRLGEAWASGGGRSFERLPTGEILNPASRR